MVYIMEDTVTIVRLDEKLLLDWQTELRNHSIIRPEDYFQKCLLKNSNGEMITYLAYQANRMAGCVNLIFQSSYEHFRENKIPEINALDVFPEFRRKGIASKMFDVCEEQASQFTDNIGVGVGLNENYGNAQRLYCSRGYIPDGRGVMYNCEKVQPGTSVPVDDNLALYLIKSLKPE